MRFTAAHIKNLHANLLSLCAQQLVRVSRCARAVLRGRSAGWVIAGWPSQRERPRTSSYERSKSSTSHQYVA